MDKVEEIREASLALESGAVLPCNVLVNAREPPFPDTMHCLPCESLLKC